MLSAVHNLWWSASIAGEKSLACYHNPTLEFSMSCLSGYNLHCWHTLTAAFMPFLCLPGMLESLEGVWSCLCIRLLKGKGGRAGPSLLFAGSGVHGCWRDAAVPVQPLAQSERRLCTADSCAAPWEVKMGVTKMGLLALQCAPGAAPGPAGLHPDRSSPLVQWFSALLWM